MRAAITAVLPEPAPAITWTGPIGAVIAAHCSKVGSRSLSARRMLAVAVVAVAAVLGLMTLPPRVDWPPQARRRSVAAAPAHRWRAAAAPRWRPAAEATYLRLAAAPARGSPRPAATWGR